MQQQIKRADLWWKRPLGRVENQMRGYQKNIWCKIWDAEAVRKLRMDLGFFNCIVRIFALSAGSYRIG